MEAACTSLVQAFSTLWRAESTPLEDDETKYKRFQKQVMLMMNLNKLCCLQLKQVEALGNSLL